MLIKVVGPIRVFETMLAPIIKLKQLKLFQCCYQLKLAVSLLGTSENFTNGYISSLFSDRFNLGNC
jgi:hypothetical protein